MVHGDLRHGLANLSMSLDFLSTVDKNWSLKESLNSKIETGNKNLKIRHLFPQFCGSRQLFSEKNRIILNSKFFFLS